MYKERKEMGSSFHNNNYNSNLGLGQVLLLACIGMIHLKTNVGQDLRRALKITSPVHQYLHAYSQS